MRIMFMGDSPFIPTGYANQLRGISRRLFNKGHDISYFAWQYWGQVLTKSVFEDGTEIPFPVLPNASQNDFGQQLLPEYLNMVKPDIFFVLSDIFMIQYVRNIDMAPIKFLMYFPSDGGATLPVGYQNVTDKADSLVAMSKFAQKQATDLGIKNVDYIPHATDTNIFHPLDKIAIKEKWSRIFGVDLVNNFVVGAVMRFQGRKMAAELFKAFATFNKKHPDSILLLHSDKNDNANPGLLIDDLEKRLGIQNKVYWTGMKFYRGYPESILNEIYNTFDVHALTTSGEGWGIPTIEAMSCEVPSVITDYTTTKEIVTDNNAGIAVPLSTEITGTYNVERAMVDKDKFADALSYMYEHPKERIEMGKNGRRAVIRDYSWDVVFPQWERKLKELSEK